MHILWWHNKTVERLLIGLIVIKSGDLLNQFPTQPRAQHFILFYSLVCINVDLTSLTTSWTVFVICFACSLTAESIALWSPHKEVESVSECTVNGRMHAIWIKAPQWCAWQNKTKNMIRQSILPPKRRRLSFCLLRHPSCEKLCWSDAGMLLLVPAVCMSTMKAFFS